MHGLSAIDDDRRFRPARTDAPLIAHPVAPRAAHGPGYPTAHRAAARFGRRAAVRRDATGGVGRATREPAAERGPAVRR